MKTIKRLTLCALFALCSLYANAYSFSATNSDGVLIYYSITTSDEYEYAVSVSYNSNRYYRGTIKIPETATNNSTGRKYTVIGISTDALFWGGGVTTIELSSTISYINGRIGSSNTPRITSLNPEPPTCASDSFSSIPSTCILYVPKGSKEAYSTAEGWKRFYNIEEIEDPDGIESVIASSDDAEVVGYYTIDGRAVDTPQRGVNIVRYSDGSTKKVLVK